MEEERQKKKRHHNFRMQWRDSLFALYHDHCSFMVFLWLFRFQDFRLSSCFYPCVNRYLFVVSFLKTAKNASDFLWMFCKTKIQKFWWDNVLVGRVVCRSGAGVIA